MALLATGGRPSTFRQQVSSEEAAPLVAEVAPELLGQEAGTLAVGAAGAHALAADVEAVADLEAHPVVVGAVGRPLAALEGGDAVGEPAVREVSALLVAEVGVLLLPRWAGVLVMQVQLR